MNIVLIAPEGRFIPVNMDRCQDLMGGLFEHVTPALEWHRQLESLGQREALREVVLVLVVCLIASMECILSRQQGCH